VRLRAGYGQEGQGGNLLAPKRGSEGGEKGGKSERKGMKGTYCLLLHPTFESGNELPETPVERCFRRRSGDRIGIFRGLYIPLLSGTIG